MQTGQNSFVKEILSGTGPVRRLTLCMATDEPFHGKRDTDAFNYQPFLLQRLEISRENSVPIP